MPEHVRQIPARGCASFLWSLRALGLTLLLAASAEAAVPELCGNGFDDAASGYTKGACPAGWMDAAWSTGCDLKCPTADGDNDGFTTNGSGEMSSGSATVNGAQTGVNAIVVDATFPLHRLLPGKRVTFYDGVTAGNVTRNIIGYGSALVTVDGAAVNVADDAVLTAAEQKDCDDSNKLVYPGIYRTCGTDGTQLCQPDGTWTACAEGELCEAISPGVCYYIDPVTGSDSDSGLTRALAFETTKKIHDIADADGTVIYLMSGTHDTVHTSGGPSYSRMIGIRNRDCTPAKPCKVKNYPGQLPIVDDSSVTTAADNARAAIHLYDNENWLIEGIEVDGNDLGVGAGLRLETNVNILVRNMQIHNRTGSYDNLGGLYVSGGTNAGVQNSTVYEVTGNQPGAGGEANVMVFLSDVSIIGSSIFPLEASLSFVGEKANHCVHNKHSGYTNRTDWLFNSFWNCGDDDHGFRFAGANTRFSHNRVANSRNLFIGDNGGTAHQRNTDFSSNSFIDMSNHFLDVVPDLAYNQSGSAAADRCSGDGEIANLTFTNNLVEVLSSADAFIGIGQYSPDSLFTNVITGDKLTFSNNHFTNGGTLTFCSYCANNGNTACAGYGNLGTTHSGMAAWQAEGFDAGSEDSAITFDEYQMTDDRTRGWLGGIDYSGATSKGSMRGKLF